LDRSVFADAQGLAVSIEFHHTKALRVGHVVTEHCGALVTRRGLQQGFTETGAVENVVAEHQTDVVFTDELTTDDERLSEAVRARLNRVTEAQTQLAAVAEHALEARQIFGGGDDQISRISASISTDSG